MAQKLLNILFCVRDQLLIKEGGDTYQILLLKELLESLGHQVSLSLHLDLIDLKGFQIIHFFNLSLMDQNYMIFLEARKLQIKTCLSPIFQDLRIYNQKGRFSRFSRLLTYLSYDSLENIRLSQHLWKRQISLRNFLTLITSSYSQKASLLLDSIDLIFCNSNQEQKTIEDFFQVNLDHKSINIVPCIRSKEILETDTIFMENFPHKEYILVVGRIEDLKNQVRILQSLQDLKIEIIFIGSINLNHKNYYKTFQRLINQSEHLSYYYDLDRKTVLSAIKHAKLVLQISCFENFGLVSLEAHLFQRKLLLSQHGFFNQAMNTHYKEVDPYNPLEIQKQVLFALENQSMKHSKTFCDPIELEKSFLANTLQAYLKILS
ncbi:glycosyltransferase [bacterium]|nr:glycosyltransferase [bacterium]